MSRRQLLASFAVVLLISLTCIASTGSQPGQTSNTGQQCVACHTTVTPSVVSDWKQSRHHEMGIECDTCHGTAHTTAADAAKAAIPTPETCGQVP